LQLPPLSLYIHIPWCIKKCPYCDFNSHEVNNSFNQDEYIRALILDLKQDLSYIQNRQLISIFIGGGTPSLFDAKYIGYLLDNINQYIDFANNIEITLEANPGTFEQTKFITYHQIGINRLSIGVQSFNNQHLADLGRIHNKDDAIQAINLAVNIFDNINVDLMFGLANQSINDALNDLQTAINLDVKHISWYQLTIEPNTYFYKNPPQLPTDDYLFNIQKTGQSLLANNDFKQYEISAYYKNNSGDKLQNDLKNVYKEGIRNYQAQHNLNYWQFGDYLGIGSGAHGKVTLDNQIIRTIKKRSPNNYLKDQNNFYSAKTIIKKQDLPFEFLLNVLRLNNGVSKELFVQRTGLNLSQLNDNYNQAIKLGLLQNHPNKFITTNKGKLFLNDLLQLFLL